MLNFPPPPQPPIDTSQLESLAEYYRSLADYYRRAAEIASQQLSHVEALLHPIELLGFSEENDLDGWLETHKSNGFQTLEPGSGVPQLSATVADESHQHEQEDTPFQSNEKSQTRTDSELSTLLTTELESNRGKMLHLDYLVREIYGAIDEDKLESAKKETRSLLEKGMQQQKWFAVPDAPDCWTIDLSEFPDLTEPKTSTKRSPTSPPRTTLVGSED
ncbi:MAG: hypothetical protein HC820_09140 [Hydrococcus sp. RM1_1_31]|nr:hypothetical protein [Hydrococcus sp. RM1_1_31]